MLKTIVISSPLGTRYRNLSHAISNAFDSRASITQLQQCKLELAEQQRAFFITLPTSLLFNKNKYLI